MFHRHTTKLISTAVIKETEALDEKATKESTVFVSICKCGEIVEKIIAGKHMVEV